MKHLWPLVLAACAACSSTQRTVPSIGTARAVAEFATYDIRRVGLLPPAGEGVDPEFSDALRDALATSFSAQTPYELVILGPTELEAVGRLDPARTGRTRAATVLELARRSALDAILTVRVVDLRPYEPVRLGLEVDLVTVETGLVAWSCRVRVDTADRTTREAMQAWQELVRSGGETERTVEFFSPRRIAEFAAAQAALLL